MMNSSTLWRLTSSLSANSSCENPFCFLVIFSRSPKLIMIPFRFCIADHVCGVKTGRFLFSSIGDENYANLLVLTNFMYWRPGKVTVRISYKNVRRDRNYLTARRNVVSRKQESITSISPFQWGRCNCVYWPGAYVSEVLPLRIQMKVSVDNEQTIPVLFNL